MISSTCFGQTFAHLQERLSSFLHTVHVVPRCRAPNPCLTQQQDTTPYVVKKPQSCAPEDGQKFAQNMLSWSWRSVKLLSLHLVGFYINLPTLMMHGQTQIKFCRFHDWPYYKSCGFSPASRLGDAELFPGFSLGLGWIKCHWHNLFTEQ